MTAKLNKKYETIIKDLKIKENDGFDKVWDRLQDLLKEKPTATLSYHEAKLGWNLIQKYKPTAFCELGVQFGHSSVIWIDALRTYGGRYVGIELGDSKENNYPSLGVGTMEFLEDAKDVIKIWGNAETNLSVLCKIYKIGMVFHDAAHTWDHVHKCVSIAKKHNCIQLCHDCRPEGTGVGSWNPKEETAYGVIWAERPVFKELLTDGYLAFCVEEHGLGVYIPK